MLTDPKKILANKSILLKDVHISINNKLENKSLVKKNIQVD